MYVLPSAHDLFENLQIKIPQPKFLNEKANGHRLTKLQQDTKDKLTVSLLKKNLKIPMG